jgi:hypothetical protein
MSSRISHVPAVSIVPPLRCYFRPELLGAPICGHFAHWMRPGNHWFDPEYFCDEHRGPIDVLAPAEHVFRRVRLELHVLLSAAALNVTPAHTEALARLEAAVRAAGGVLDVQGVRSMVVRSSAHAGAGLASAAPIVPA